MFINWVFLWTYSPSSVIPSVVQDYVEVEIILTMYETG